MSRIPTVPVAVIAALALGACEDATAPTPRRAAPHPSLATVAFGSAIDLGTLPGGGGSEAHRVNNLGHVVGWATTSSGQDHAVVWLAPGQLLDLGTLPGGAQSYAFGINAVSFGPCTHLPCPGGVEYVVGGSDRLVKYKLWFGLTITRMVRHAFLWSAQGGMVDLGTLGGDYSLATGVNAAGAVVGLSSTAGGATHAFAWSSGGGMQDLGALGTPGESAAWDLDAAGAAGAAGSTTISTHAVVWGGGGAITDMGALPGASYSYGNGINAAGWVAGYGFTTAGAEHAVLWTAPNQPVDLGTLPAATWAEGNGVNDLGWVVGTSDWLPFLWTSADGMRQLPSLGGATEPWGVAADINGGIVVGQTQLSATRHATMWVLSQVPPPA